SILPAVSEHRLHVLFVARWYPSHDQLGRGTFVADLAAALLATGEVDVTVASFDPSHVRGVTETRPERGRRAEGILALPLATPMASNRPRSWGVPDLPVARLPVLLDGDRRRPGQVVDAHVAPLLAFGRALGMASRIDVVHAHTGLPDGVAAARLADELDVPLL